MHRWHNDTMFTEDGILGSRNLASKVTYILQREIAKTSESDHDKVLHSDLQVVARDITRTGARRANRRVETMGMEAGGQENESAHEKINACGVFLKFLAYGRNDSIKPRG